jgi:hypothetical protein
MKKKTLISVPILIFMTLTIISGCATGKKVVSGEEWDYVALGGSRTAITSYPEYYAAAIEADLNVRVTVHNKAQPGQTSGSLLWQLQNNEILKVK